MSAWKRWQDYATIAFGVILIISPFVFGETLHHRSPYVAFGLGALLALSGIVAAATREPRRSLIVNAPGIAAVITLIGALILGFVATDSTVSQGRAEMAWTAGVLAILTVLVGATFRIGRQPT